MASTDRDNDIRNGGQGRLAAATDKVRRTASDAYEAARERTSTLYGSARERASGALESTRSTASRARQRTADGVDANPMAALLGGFAVGALVAAILPRSRQEAAVLGPVGSRIGERAREAARAAREAGRDKLDELGLSRDAARQKLSELASNAGEAVRSSADAALRATRRSE